MVLSVYHPDAIDHHGAFVGGPEEFVDWAFNYHTEHHEAHHHMVMNHSCELNGDTAHTETYWIFSGINKQGPPSIHFGRYLDRFERRNGEWKIALRRSTVDVILAGDASVIKHPAFTAQGYTKGIRDKRDVSYQRPLSLDSTPERW